MREGTLIPPIPKEYLTYSYREKLQKTENYYRKIDDLYRRMDVSGGDYRKRLNLLLQKGAALDKVFEVLMEKEAQILCLYEYDYFVLKMLCQIAQKEEAFKLSSILRNVRSVEEAVCLYQRCVFLLRRFEFDWEEDEELFLLVQEQGVSYISLAELICGEGIVCKVHTGSRIALYLCERGLKREALFFLMWLDKQLPYSERKIMVFSMTLLDLGEKQLAYEVLMKHQNPDKDIKELQTMLSEMV